ncbi:MAG: protein phosphatase 2C domain-containing protein [Armatimonadia bacterium]
MDAMKHAVLPLSVRPAAATHGGQRGLNQDRFLLLTPPDDGGDGVRCVAAVADGMGGVGDGGLAAQAAVDALAAVAAPFLSGEVPAADMLAGAFRSAQDAVRRIAGQSDAPLYTTLTTVAFEDAELCWAHVGDSRLYLLREGVLRQLTRDHNDAEGRLTQALGYAIPPALDHGRETLFADDVVLICSDGIVPASNMSDRELADLLIGQQDPEASAQALVEKALTRGSQDNVTAVVLCFAIPNCSAKDEPVAVRSHHPVAESRGTVGSRGWHEPVFWSLAGAVLLAAGLLCGWTLRSIRLAPQVSEGVPSGGDIGTPRYVASFEDGSRLVLAPNGRGPAVVTPHGEALSVTALPAPSTPSSLAASHLAYLASGGPVEWNAMAKRLTYAAPEGPRTIAVAESGPPESVLVDAQGNLWLIYAGRLYLARTATRPPSQERTP